MSDDFVNGDLTSGGFAPAYPRRTAAARAEGMRGRRSRLDRSHRWAPRNRVAPLWILGKIGAAPTSSNRPLEIASGDDVES